MKSSSLIHLMQCAVAGLRAGARLRDKWLAFLLACLGQAGRHRQGFRGWLLRQLKRSSVDGTITVTLRRPPMRHAAHLRLREGNESDYLVVAELLHQSRSAPSSAPGEIIDCGANIGTFSVWAAAVFPDVPLHCYEPEPDNVTRLRENLAVNRIANAQVHPVGVWSADTTLYFHPAASYAGHIDERPPGEPIVCKFPLVTDRSWLKLDVEGAEYVVVPEMLKRGLRPAFISMEVHDACQRGARLIALLREHGYEIHGRMEPDHDCWEINALRR